MMREKYESLALHDLKEIAKARGMKGISAMKKAELVEAMLALDEKEASEKKREGKRKGKRKGKKRKSSPGVCCGAGAFRGIPGIGRRPRKPPSPSGGQVSGSLQQPV